ncbi:MAG: transcriptional regulator [Alphaproteobacteria bacterium]|nr:MAG: transcriptional regulator [Alphaproteobacteria bacterium]
MLESIAYIAQQIKEARETKGLSQRALSEKVGIPQSHISRIENGAVNLQLSSLIELARVLELELILVPKEAQKATGAIIREAQRPKKKSDIHNQLVHSSASKNRAKYQLDDED